MAMVSRNVLKSNYKQVGGTCLLASYAFLLEYAGVFERSWIIHDVYDVFSAYLRFHGTLEPVERLTSDQIRSGGRDAERMVGKAINRYCISHGGIAGYRQIDRFHRWLASKGYFSGIDVVDVAPPLGAPRSKPIAGVYRTVSSFLRQESAKEYHGALILYLAGGGAHTVFLGYDGDFFIRDSNYPCQTGNKASFDFSFQEQSPITEYMLFRIVK